MNVEALVGAKPTSSRYPYLNAGGTYDLVIKSIEEKSRSVPMPSKKFVVELAVESRKQDTPEAVVNAPDTTAVAIFDGLSEIGLGNFLSFLNAVEGANIQGDAAKIKKTLQLAPGCRIRCSAVGTTTKKGNPFTRLNWQTLKNDAESIKANRKKYDIADK